MSRALALVDGEHYAPVVRDALRELPHDVVGALLVGGTEKLRGDDDYGLPVVDDLDAALARAAQHGVLPGGEVIARGDGVKRAFVTDPDDNIIELMQTGVEVTGAEPRLTAPQRG